MVENEAESRVSIMKAGGVLEESIQAYLKSLKDVRSNENVVQSEVWRVGSTGTK